MRTARFLAVATAVAAAATVVTPPATADGRGYRYFQSRDGAKKPGAYWNPCAVVTYGIDYTYAQRLGMRKSWERQRWQSAIAEVGDVLGVRFRYRGAIQTRSVRSRPKTNADVDLVITFGNGKSAGNYGYRKAVRGDVAGLTRVNWRSTSRQGRYRIFAGSIVIDAAQVVRFTNTWAAAPDLRAAKDRSPDVLRALYMHEFGHAVGLDHVNDKKQLMYPQLLADRPDALASGDLRGLRRMANQPCF